MVKSKWTFLTVTQVILIDVVQCLALWKQCKSKCKTKKNQIAGIVGLPELAKFFWRKSDLRWLLYNMIITNLLSLVLHYYLKFP